MAFETEYQTPTPIIEVYLPSNASTSEPDFSFRPYVAAGALSGLKSYNFSESVDDLNGSFSFSITSEEIGEKDIFDLIPIRSIVKIYETQDSYKFYPSFVGIIRSRKINKQMTNSGLKRIVTFSGKSIISCITEYTVALDMKIQSVANATAKNNQMLSEINNIFPLTIKTFMEESWKYFKKIAKEVSEAANGVSTIGLEKIIDKYIGDEFISVTGAEQDFRYGIFGILVNSGNNTIIDVWRDKLPKPVYELFTLCKDGQPIIMSRQVPFGDPEKNNCADWKSLKLYKIRPVSLISYDLEQNDEEVYTVAASYIAGSQRDRNFYMAINQDGSKDTTVCYSEKANIYGFKPLQITFNGYSRKNNKDEEEGRRLHEVMQELNILAMYWYSRNDDMYSGTITVITDFKNPQVNPSVGCRAKFLGGEFYINKTEHSWNYLGTPTIKLSVSRGMIYDENGKIRDGEDGIIQDVGKKYRELDGGEQ